MTVPGGWATGFTPSVALDPTGETEEAIALLVEIEDTSETLQGDRQRLHALLRRGAALDASIVEMMKAYERGRARAKEQR